jgi:hypothetical protein
MPGARTAPGRVMSTPCSVDFLGAVAGASTAASICCLSWLKRMPSGLRASAGADFNQASLMSLRRPCFRPSQWRRKASTSVVSAVRTSSARVAKAAAREGSSKVVS